MEDSRRNEDQNSGIASDEPMKTILQLKENQAPNYNSSSTSSTSFRGSKIRVSDLPVFLCSLGSSIKGNPYDYALWCTRWRLAEELGLEAKSNELEFTKEILFHDANNMYAWSHRKWVLKEFGGLENELAFCNELLKVDSSSSSTWSQRFAVTGPEEAFAEIIYTIKAILENPENEHPWMYLRSLYKKYVGCDKDDEEVKKYDKDDEEVKKYVGCDKDDEEVHRKLDNLFSESFDVVPLSDRATRHIVDVDVDVIQLVIVKHRRKLVCALEALVDLVYHGYDPKPTGGLVYQLCPTSKVVGFSESICIILEFACPLRAPHWRWLTDRLRAKRKASGYAYWL